MTKQTITIGSLPNDHTGDPLRTAFTKINANFTELYATTSSSATGDWAWPFANGMHTRATLGGSQNSHIDGQTPGGLKIGNDYAVTLGAGSSYFVFQSNGVLQLPVGGALTYTPSAPQNWVSPAPTTIQDAINRIAVVIKSLNGVGA